MKKIIAALSLFLLAFSAFAQEQKSDGKESKNEITFSIDEKSDKEMRLIVTGDGFLGINSYKFLDGEKISHKELDGILKEYAEKKYVKRMKISTVLGGVFLCGFWASTGASLYAANKGWDEMYSNSYLIGEACLLSALVSNSILILSRNQAVESYNLKVLGLNQEK